MPEIMHTCVSLEVQNNYHWALLLFFFCYNAEFGGQCGICCHKRVTFVDALEFVY